MSDPAPAAQSAPAPTLEEFIAAALECADDLEAEVRAHWFRDGEIHPAYVRKFEQDMVAATRVRTLAAALESR